MFVIVFLSPSAPSSLIYNIRVVSSFSTTTTTTTTKTTTSFLSGSWIPQRQNIIVAVAAATASNENYDDKTERTQDVHNNNNNKNKRERERERRELLNKLRRARDSILYYGQDGKNKAGRPPSIEFLASGIVPELVQKYSSAIINASKDDYKNSNIDSVMRELTDPYHDVRERILTESRPVQERMLGLLAVLILATTYVEEEYYNNNDRHKNKVASTAKVNNYLYVLRSQLWNTCQSILNDMIVGGGDRSSSRSEVNDDDVGEYDDDDDDDDDKVNTSIENGIPHIVSPIAVTALAKALRESSAIKTKSYTSSSSSSSTIDNNSSNNISINNVNGVDNFGAVEIKELMQLVKKARVAAVALANTNHTNNTNRKNRSNVDDVVDIDDNMDRSLLVAWNLYLSSLCDQALVTENPNDAGLEVASNLLIQQRINQTLSGQEEYSIVADIASYNTILIIAAKVGNSSLVETLWNDLITKRGQQLQQLEETKHRKESEPILQPNSRTYNARLMVTKDPARRLEILDQEILPTAYRCHRKSMTEENSLQMTTASATTNSMIPLIIDSFTIDLVLIPLVQADRKKDLYRLIDQWMAMINCQQVRQDQRQRQLQGRTNDSRSGQQLTLQAERTFRNALSAFFITLVQRNEDDHTARELWDRYMVLDIDIVHSNDSDDDSGSNSSLTTNVRTTNIVPPERRHYNILLDGYARLVDRARDEQEHDVIPSLSSDEESDPIISMAYTKIMEADGNYDYDSIYASARYYRKIQEQAIQDGQELFAHMMAQQQQRTSRNKVGPDAYTRSTMIRLCRNGTEVQYLLERAAAATSTASAASKTGRTWLPRAVIRAAVTTCGRLKDPSMACNLFDQYMFPSEGSSSNNNGRMFSNYRAFNVLLGALAAGAKMGNPKLDLINPTGVEGKQKPSSSFLSQLDGLTCIEAVICILNLMTAKNSQTYCVAASALQYASIDESMRLSHAISDSSRGGDDDDDNNDNSNTSLALQIFRRSRRDGIRADGRLVNAIFRCYGDNIVGALDGWKTEIRKATTQNENHRSRHNKSKSSMKKKNIIAAYNGLLYVCGRAERPDIAVRIVYAMKNKEGLEPSENPYNNYRSGKRTRLSLIAQNKQQERQRGILAKFLPKLDMVGQYEDILYVECKQYDTRDRRTENEKRVRITV